MDHIDFETEQYLFAPLDSSSTDQRAEHVSNPTPRRLIRKPLPDLPPSQAEKVGDHSIILGSAGSPKQHAITLEESRERANRIALEEQKQLDWWPSTIKEKPALTVEAQQNEAGPSNLSEYYKRHLFRIIETSLDASGRPSKALAKSIFEALEDCLDTLATPKALKALHQSYSFLWRVEAMLRSNEQVDFSKASKMGVRWPRLGGWRGSLSASLNGLDTTARRRRRDIALQLLGGAFWMNGSVSTLENSDISDEIVAEAPSEKITHKKSPFSAPQLLVKNSLPTVALQTDNGDQGSKVKATEQEAEEKTSTLTTRLALQLKNSEKNQEKNPPPPSIQRKKSAQMEEDKIMAVCKVCLEYVDGSTEQEGTLRKHRRTRSGTLTLSTNRREQNTSVLSDHTIRGIDTKECDATMQISWKPNEYDGSPLFLNPLSSEAEGRDQSRTSSTSSEITFVGGTFLVVSDRDDPEEEDIVRNILDIGLYSASAMMLESALLCNFQLEERVEQLQSEETAVVPEAEERDHGEKPDPVALSKHETIEADVDKQSKWPTSFWSVMHYTTTGQSSSKEVPSSPNSRLNLKKSGKRASSYSNRLGKLLNTFTGSTSKRPTSADQTEETPDLAQEMASDQVEQNVEVEAPNSPPPEEELEQYSAPVAISPYLSDQAASDRTDYLKEDYMEHLLSQQSLYLTVLEGVDLSLSTVKQQDEATIQRAPLLSRRSFNEAENKMSGSISSAHSSTKSGRSSNSYLQVDQQIAVKQQSILPISIESNPSWDEKNQREVQFYQRAGSSRDVSLGQAVEEMAAKASSMDKEAKEAKKSKETKESKDLKESEKHMKPRSASYRIAQYLHGQDRITVIASVKDNNTCLVGNDVAPNQSETQSSAECLQNEDPSETKAKEEDQLCIILWTADFHTGEETTAMIMSEATYLSSYGAFIQAILSHPKFVQEKHSVVRMFRIGDITLKFHVQPIVVFDLLVEGPVVILHKEKEDCEAKSKDKQTQDEELLERTRLEIQSFYSSIKRHVSSLEHVLVARELDDKGKTIKSSSLSSRSSICSVLDGDSKSDDSSSQVDGFSFVNPSSRALTLLAKLKKSFRKVEFELYDGLKMTKANSINDIRIQFQHRARSAKKRLSAWEAKHLNEDEAKELEPLDYFEPEYFEVNIHVFPGSCYLVREDEPLSMIAYTLSSKEFDEEMHRREQRDADVQNWRSSVRVPSTQSQLSSSKASTNTAVTTSKTTTDSQATLDPDKDEDFDVQEPLQVQTKRKKRVKDVGILSLRLRRASSNVSSISGSESASTTSKEQHIHKADASLVESDLTATPTTSRIAPSSKFDTISSSNDTFRAQVAHVAARGSLGSMFDGGSSIPPTPSEEKFDLSLPEVSVEGHDEASSKEASNAATTQTPTHSSFQRRAVSQPIESQRRETKASSHLSPHVKHSIISGNLKISCVSWFAEEFAELRRKWNIEEDFLDSMTRCKSWSMMGGKSKSGFFVTLDGKWIAKQLLSIWSVDEKEAFLEFAPAYLRHMTDSVVNDSPTLLVKIAGVYTLKFKNIKTGEVKLKMSVQVLENVFAGDEGESIRFDIKGIRDRRVQVKKENGGQEEEERAPVWWDGEWLDTFQSRAFVPQSQRRLFGSALHNDLAFLKASNIMDYSLLIGAHEASNEIRDEKTNSIRSKSVFTVRIVDYTGAFTLAKYIESSSKKAIQSQAPTIIPPHDYAFRFAKAVETYFIPCPS